MDYRLCALIPTYNHHNRLAAIVLRLKQAGLPILIVDDGSDEATQTALKKLSDVEILRLPVNGGKGAALELGLKRIAEHGYTHAFQIDADGQHALDSLETFIEISKNAPNVLLSGKPVYDASLPFGRKVGRWLTHIFVWIETLSFRISDSMCGFRIYPVKSSLAVITQSFIGRRMDFDTEIMVRMFWLGTPIVMQPVKVTYPEDNHSNFKLLRDNWLITKMHTRLVTTMLAKLPVILRQRPDYSFIDKQRGNWFDTPERGTILGLILLATAYRLLGRTICSIMGAPVVLYFFLTGSKQRRVSREFLTRASKINNLSKNPTVIEVLRHFMSFFQMLLDKFAAWGGYLSADSIICDDPAYTHQVMTAPEGKIMFVSHIGCMEFCRALMGDDQKRRMHILMHSKNGKNFNRVMSYFNPQSTLNIVEVSDIGADTILFLKERIENGDWVVIPADRVPVSANPRVVCVPFLGDEAPFSQGPYILAALLECPVYTGMAVRQGSKYKVFIELFAKKITLQRGRKEACIKEYAQQYACYLERFCTSYPYQWFNFFDFWQKQGKGPGLH